MNSTERELITDLKKCDFRQMDTYFKEQSEKRKAMTKEEKLKIKEEKEAETKIYGFAFIDGHKQKVANFRIEPPGLLSYFSHIFSLRQFPVTRPAFSEFILEEGNVFFICIAVPKWIIRGELAGFRIPHHLTTMD